MPKCVNPTTALQQREQAIGRERLAKELGVGLPYLVELLHGRRVVSARILAKLGLRRVVVEAE